MAGLYRANKSEKINVQTKTVTATTSAQTVTPDSGYDALSEVTVNPQSHSGSKSYTVNGQKDLGTNHNTRYVNINVPGVELPSELEIKCAINVSSTAYPSSGALGTHDIYTNADNVTIPSFLCENFTSFMVSLSNVTSAHTPTLVAYPTGSTTKTITKDTKYTIVNYANSSGNLIIGLTNLRTYSGGNPQVDISATITVKLIKS